MLLGSLWDRLCLCSWTHELHPGRVANRLRRILKVESEDCGQISGDTPGQSAFPEILLRTVRELDEYFRGERKEFDIPLLLAGSEFQKRVWQQLRHIPYGQTVSYGELAAAIGAPKSVRAVANANGANAISIILPCHRVIGSDGSLTGYGGGIDTKRYLLELESNKTL
ncbi:MAG TPA: methylated-DNA--[protein]-cysteine S-methyltransferase [Candidatus Coprenecus pullicola]|nr:methylated-DNA--[protein]-cysteine S-methyltransferase [Candidatus Coprenecus pullicola]